jgi:hypothetical protein
MATATLSNMEVLFTPEQEAKLAQIASSVGLAPAQLVQDAVLRLIGDHVGAQKRCPECDHIFQGSGWDGIDAHWRSKHESVMGYEEAWPLIRSGGYVLQRLEDLGDLRIAEERLTNLKNGQSRTYSLEEVERELGLVD